ncbi:MAG: type II secretion system F family protein [Thermoplasmatota archaeon]
MTSTRFLALVAAAMLLAAPAALAQDEATAGVVLNPDETDGPIVTVLAPLAGGFAINTTPIIIVEFADPDGVDVGSAVLRVNGLDVSDLEEQYTVTETGLEYRVPGLFAMKLGNQTLNLTVADNAGNTVEVGWHFTVDPRHGQTGGGLSLQQIGLLVLLVFVVLVAAAAGTLVYFQKTRNFNLRKWFRRNPVQREYLVLYVPAALGALALIFGLLALGSWEDRPRWATEYVLLGAAALGSLPFGLDLLAQKRRKAAFEAGFAQFLFELADAVRGGIDPLKAVKELAKTETGVLGRHLRVAADGIRLGRPFEVVMANLARPTKSPLIERYASLVGEASGMGGEIASIIYRAAKDMDELVKIEAERKRQLQTPVVTMYIAFGVLLMMINSLMGFAPSLGEVDASALGGGDGVTRAAPKMDLSTLEDRFFHLVLINSLGAGLLVGSFTSGKLQYGILHAAIMGAIAVAAYVFVIVPQ